MKFLTTATLVFSRKEVQNLKACVIRMISDEKLDASKYDCKLVSGRSYSCNFDGACSTVFVPSAHPSAWNTLKN